MKKQTLIFTDLDGTLIDYDTYGFEGVQTTLDKLRRRSIPVIICSSKTRAEIEMYRLRMGFETPFVAENGAAVFIPLDLLSLTGEGTVEREGYHVMEFGVRHGMLCDILRKVKQEEDFPITGLSEMTIDEIRAHTGLSLEEARLAVKREYSEPFLFFGTADQLELLKSLLQERGLQIAKGGRFYHLIGQNDKGKAVQVVTRLYASTYPDTRFCTVGLGDSANDVPMLMHVDLPIVIRKKTGGWEGIRVDRVVFSEKPGPEGWAETIGSTVLDPDGSCSV